MGPKPIRPIFEHAACMEREELVARLQSSFDGDGEAYPYQIRGQHIVVTVPRSQRHFWSPWLNMEVLDAEPGIVLHGRFSPKPSIWTGFMLCYVTLMTSGFFAIMFGISKSIMGRSGLLWDLFGVGLILAVVGLYVSSQIGQRFAQSQMIELHDRVRVALGIGQEAGAGEQVEGGR